MKAHAIDVHSYFFPERRPELIEHEGASFGASARRLGLR